MKKLVLFILFLMIHSVWSQTLNYANNLICNLVELQNDTVDIVQESANGSYYPLLRYKYVDSMLSYPAYKYKIQDTTLMVVADTLMQTYLSFCDNSRVLEPNTITCLYFDAHVYGAGFKLKEDIVEDTFLKGTFTLQSEFEHSCTFDITYRLPAGLLVTGVTDKEIENNSKITYSNNQLHFESDNQEVVIYNHAGVAVFSGTVPQKQLEVSTMHSGLYIAKSSKGAYLKFVKE